MTVSQVGITFLSYRNGKWCHGGCGCNNYKDQKCVDIDPARILHGNREAIVTLDGRQYKLSTAHYTYAPSVEAAAHAVAQGVATVPDRSTYRFSLAVYSL